MICCPWAWFLIVINDVISPTSVSRGGGSISISGVKVIISVHILIFISYPSSSLTSSDPLLFLPRPLLLLLLLIPPPPLFGVAKKGRSRRMTIPHLELIPKIMTIPIPPIYRKTTDIIVSVALPPPPHPTIHLNRSAGFCPRGSRCTLFTHWHQRQRQGQQQTSSSLILSLRVNFNIDTNDNSNAKNGPLLPSSSA